jgi:hypothetical protein
VSTKRYQVTASVGGWKLLPWPFGLLDVSTESIRLHSWGWSWWVKDREFGAREVKSVKVTKKLGTTRLLVVMSDGLQLKTEMNSPMKAVVQLFRNYGYPLDANRGLPPQFSDGGWSSGQSDGP